MDPLGSLTVFLGICIICLVFFTSRSRRIEKRQLPPGPTPLPILGNVLQLKTNYLDLTLYKLSEKYGAVFMVYFGAERVVVLKGYEAIKEALIDRGDEFAARGSLPIFDQVNQGLGIIFSNGERWKQLRRFALSTLRSFGMGKKSIEERIQEEAQCLLEEFRGTQEKPFDPTFLLSCAFSNVICAIVFGNRYEYKDKKFLTMLSFMNDNFAIMSSPWGQLYNIFPSFMEYIPGPHHRFARNHLAMREFILDEIELHKPTLDSSAPRDFIDCFLIKMDQGTTIYPILTSVLHDSKEFPNPKEFDPQHFLHEDGTFRKSDFFLPFSAGRRICLGEGLARMELFLFFTTVLQNFKLKSLIHPKDIDLTPFLSSVGNLPQPYRLCVVPR